MLYRGSSHVSVLSCKRLELMDTGAKILSTFNEFETRVLSTPQHHDVVKLCSPNVKVQSL